MICIDTLGQFTGDLIRYRHPLNRRVIYSPGVRYIAQEGGAYWLIDAIASWIGSKDFAAAIKDDPRIGQLHFWTLERGDGTNAKLYAKADGPEDAFITQEIGFADFPLAKANIWAGWDGEHWTLYLPSEH